MAKLFGFEITKDEKEQIEHASFSPKENEDGAVLVSEAGVYGTYIDLDGSIKTEAELINKYREMAEYPEVDFAVDDIVNEVIIQEPDQEIVELNLDDLDQPDKIKNLIIDEFNETLKLLEFNSLSYDIFKRWYVDGRLYYHAIIDENKPSEGIKELRYIDPRKIRKIKNTKRKRIGTGAQSATITVDDKEYYIYNETGFANKSGANVTPTSNVKGIRIAKDSIVHCTSGVNSKNGDLVLSHLHKAIKPLNMLKSLEDSLVIYRISRAPERRIFYIDVGGLPRMKAEQYLKDIMNKFKNKLVYNAETGEMRGDKKFMTMLEDFWLPRRDGGRGTEITTLPGGQNLGDIEDILYFQKKMYKSLNVPVSRIDPDTQFNFGRASEITRDEIKFSKFIARLRAKFSNLFLKILERQLILKKVITPSEWDEFRQVIRFKFCQDNFYAELKESEIMRDRIALLRDIDDYAGKYYSHEWIRRKVLRQSDEEIKEIDKEISTEMDNPQYNPPMEDQGEEMPGDGSDNQGQPPGAAPVHVHINK